VKTPPERPKEPDGYDRRFLDFCRSFAGAAGIFAIVVGSITLLGWFFGIGIFLRTLPGMIVMKANAALAFVLLGISLRLVADDTLRTPLREVAGGCAALAGLLGLLTLFEHATGADLGIDQVLAVEAPGAVKTASPGRMAPNAALDFTLLGGSLLLLAFRRGHRIVSWMAAASMTVAFLALMGYAYASETFIGFGSLTHIAVQTALALLALSAGTLLCTRELGLMEPLSRRDAGSRMACRLLPAVILVPFLLALIRYELHRRNPDSDEFGVAVMVIICMAVLAAVVWRNAAALNRADTERSRNALGLARTTEILEKIFSTTHMKMAYLDPEFRFIRVNQAYADACGYPPEFFPGKNHFDLYPHPENEAIFSEVIGTGKPYTVFAKPFEFPDHPERGVTYWDWSLQVVRGESGQAQGLLFCLLDVTEQRRAELELRASEERFRTAVENSPVGLSIVQDGRIVFRNPEQRRLFGGLPEGFEFEKYPDIHPEDAEPFRELLRSIRAGERLSRLTSLRFYPYGKASEGADMRWTHAYVTPIGYSGRAAALVTMVDVTNTKEMEQAAHRQERLAILGQTAAGVAHEIRNPLQGVLINLSVMETLIEEAVVLDPEARDTIRRSLSAARSGSDKIENVIRRVMDFVRPKLVRFEAVEINTVVREAVELVAVSLRNRGIRLETALSEGLPPCNADTQLIEQLLLNLITNAAQATEQRDGVRRIEVATELDGDAIVIRVADSGPGVAEHHRKRIFDPFFTTRELGTGLGLSISRRIVKDHSGSIHVGASRFGGAEFTVRLPSLPQASGRDLVAPGGATPG